MKNLTSSIFFALLFLVLNSKQSLAQKKVLSPNALDAQYLPQFKIIFPVRSTENSHVPVPFVPGVQSIAAKASSEKNMLDKSYIPSGNPVFWTKGTKPSGQ
jgi:hypothetical protein